MIDSYYNILETILIIYTSDEGKLKVYLHKRKDEPYKGYWTLPTSFLSCDELPENNVQVIFKKMTGLDNTKFLQNKTFSKLDRNPNKRIIGLSYVAITDKHLTEIKQDNENNAWFEIDTLPKMGFDHENIINEVSNDIKEKILNNYEDILLMFFPSDFTLSELQSFYENVLGKKIDRRNFHKKFVSQNLIIDTGFKLANKSGRPGTLYSFNKEKMRGKRL